MDFELGKDSVETAGFVWCEGVNTGKFPMEKLCTNGFKCFIRMLKVLDSFHGGMRTICMQHFFDTVNYENMDALHCVAKDEHLFKDQNEKQIWSCVEDVFFACLHHYNASSQGRIRFMKNFKEHILPVAIGDLAKNPGSTLEVMMSDDLNQGSFSDVSKAVLENVKIG